MKAMDNSVDYVRRNRRKFLQAEQVEPIELTERLLGDALYAGASECTVLRHKDWWIIISSTDWLDGHDVYSPEDIFQHIVPMPEAGPNAMRGEVLLMAFAQKVVTATPTACRVISGEVSMHDEVWRFVSKFPRWERMIAFSVDSSTARVV
ncbi:MAG: hypothetical protein OEU26_36610 [Candidatus Tectomicrobia bacterium]|nr:hypothetical protein [Candidatus Tectomicrobia bacterium]